MTEMLLVLCDLQAGKLFRSGTVTPTFTGWTR
jgi:hypothetical protein